MDISYLLDLKDGRISELLMCTFPPITVSLLGLQTPYVFLKTAELHHLLRHVDLTLVRNLPVMISNGQIAREHHRPKSFIAISDHNGNSYKIAMKVASGGHEVWVSTMHRTKPKQCAAILKRADIIRNNRQKAPSL